MGFGDLINLPQVQAGNQEEARFSFIRGGYVEDFENQGRLYSLPLMLATK
jgi:diphthamide biosynthesis protein 2